MLAQIGTAVGNNKDQVLAGIQGSLTGIQTRINDTSANNQDAIARAQQSLTGIHDLLNGAVGGDQSTLVAGQQHLTDTVDDVQRTIEEIVDAVGDDRVDFATVLASVRDIQTTINDGVDVNQRPLQTFVPRMLRSIENMMRAMSPHERRISSERTRKAAKVNAEVEHTSLTSTSETPSSPAGHHDSSGRPLTRSTSRGRFKAVATRARNTMDALLHPSRSTVTLAPMPEEEDVSTEAPSSHTSVSPRHVGWVAQAADFNPVGMPFQPAYPQTGLPSQPGLTQTGVSTQTGFPTYTSLPAHTRSQSQPEQIPFETRPPLPTNQNLAVWNRPPTGGPSLRSPQSTPALLTHRPYAASSQAGPAHSQMYPFTINYHQRVSPSRITVSVEVDSNAQLLRHPNDILNANSIAVGDGSENVDGYQPFATNLGADVVHRFISDLTGLLCQMPESTYARLSQPVAKTMCMYKKAAKGNAQTEDFHACTLCVGHNRICLKKIKYSGGFVMFIAPLKDSHFRLSDLGAWIPNPSAPMRLPGTKR